MGSEPKASLRVQALKKRLAHHPNGERMFEYASTLDGWMHEWARYAARKDLAKEERSRALMMLSSMRRDFNALLTEADVYDTDPRPKRSQFGTALDELGEDEKAALQQILGVPLEKQYRALFEVKAAEYLEQDALWNEITEEGGFVDTTTLLSDEPKNAVVLTYSGSLLLVSAPIEKKNFRRKYVYQSIYAGHLPTEGTLGLLEPIRKNRPIAGTRIKTSPVRKIRISRESSPEWDRHRETFFRLQKTLNDAATPSPFVIVPPTQDGDAPHGPPPELKEALKRVGQPVGPPFKDPHPLERRLDPPPGAAAPPPSSAPTTVGQPAGVVAAIAQRRAVPPAPPPPTGQVSRKARPQGATNHDSSPPPAAAFGEVKELGRIGSNTLVQGTPAALYGGQDIAEPTTEPLAESPPASRHGGPITSDHRIPSVFVQVLHNERQRDHFKRMEETARAEVWTLLARLIDTAGERNHGLEAEIIGQVMYLQRLAVERGELSVPPADLVRFETENNDLCTAVPDGLAIGKVGARSTTVHAAHFGTQTIVRGAPVAVMAKDGSLFAVLGNVRSYVRKS